MSAPIDPDLYSLLFPNGKCPENISKETQDINESNNAKLDRERAKRQKQHKKQSDKWDKE